MTYSNQCPIILAVLLLAVASCSDEAEEGACQLTAETGFASADCTIDSEARAVVINEFSSAGDDAVELFNTSDSPVSIGDWILTDDVEPQRVDTYNPLDDDEKFVFPSATVIPAEGFLVIPKGSDALSHPFGISSQGDIISLVAPDGTLISQATAPAGAAEPSYCRVPDGRGEWQTCERTMGSTNIPLLCGNGTLDDNEVCDGDAFGGTTCESISEIFTGGELSCSVACSIELHGCESSAICDADSVILNEVCHKNATCGVEGVTTGDWVELHNPTNTPATIAGCFIRVSEEGLVKKEAQLAWLPGFESLTLAPGEFWLLNDTPELFKAGKNELVELLGDDRSPINSLTTSRALSVDGDPASPTCELEESNATPGEANACGI